MELCSMPRKMYGSSVGPPVSYRGPNALLLNGCTTLYKKQPNASSSPLADNARAKAADAKMLALILSGCSTVYERNPNK